LKEIGPYRLLLISLSILALTAIFLFQGFNFAKLIIPDIGLMSKIFVFNTNKAIRFILNDIFSIMLIYALFKERRYVMFACLVQIVGMVCILFPYLILKTYYPAYNGPLISYLHRLVVNPLLLILLIPAFYYQRMQKKS
jgi:exosortase F-associated protein